MHHTLINHPGDPLVRRGTTVDPLSTGHLKQPDNPGVGAQCGEFADQPVHGTRDFASIVRRVGHEAIHVRQDGVVFRVNQGEGKIVAMYAAGWRINDDSFLEKKFFQTGPPVSAGENEPMPSAGDGNFLELG